MKVKNKSSKKSEFRRNKKTRHPAYVYASEGSNFKYLGITHSAKTNGTNNIKLQKNPNPKDSKTAFVRPKAEKAPTNHFEKKLKGWSFGKKDKETVKKLMK